MSPEKKRPKKYKRVKRVNLCCNPLFEKWLKEWYDEAAARGWKKQYIYQKALTSLKKYPLPLKSAKEAKMLEFFGDKICQMLDKKLKEHESQNALTNSDEDNGLQPSSSNQILSNLDILFPSNENDKESSPMQSPIRRRGVQGGATREYIPKYRSGGHAILITLYEHEQQMGGPGPNSYMKKTELMQAAQPLSDKSFIVPDPGKFHTAWASMGTLVIKGLVIKQSSPAKYYLTDKGRELAQKLYQATLARDNCTSTSSQSITNDDAVLPSTSNSRVLFDVNHISSSQSSTSSSVAQATIPSCTPLSVVTPSLESLAPSSESLEYYYVTENGEEVREKNKAVVTIDDAIGAGFLIKCKRTPLLLSRKIFIIDNTRQAPSNYVYAFLQNDFAEEFSPCSSLEMEALMTKDKYTALSIDNNSNCGSLPCSQKESAPLLSQELRGFTLSPGEFEVILCVDTCETVSGTVNSRKLAVQNELRKNGVAFDVRKLNVGDFLWVAREKKISFISGQLRPTKAKELVLDYVVERKRMDDLAHSIKDGRFHEQKYRLKQCGLRKPIYLVEEMPGTTQYSLPEGTLLQAIVNTEVIDGFTVKRTANQDGTVAYLTLMTRYLQSFYSNKTLQSCPYDRLPSSVNISNAVFHLLTFEEFNSFSIKNKEITVREMFIKHLVQIRGLSVDKALAIVDVYPTLASLMAAYEECTTDKEKEALVSNIKYGSGQRCIGPKLSRVLSMLYCNHTLT